jgi:hypothetical protein
MINDNLNCNDFVKRGECVTNQAWMLEHCPYACGTNYNKNTLDNVEAHDGLIARAMQDNCFDITPQCEEYAKPNSPGNCQLNPGYMNTYCKKTCTKCISNG